MLDDDTLVLDQAIDADVILGPDNIPMRLCGVFVQDKGYFFYLTNLPRSIGPCQIGDLYRVRWEIELDSKLDKSSHRLKEIDARSPAAVHALIHATLISSTLVSLIVHRYNLTIARSQQTYRTQAPLHHGIVARILSTSALRIADLFEFPGSNSHRQWQRLAQVIVHAGRNPNWRNRPSILDQLRGWKPPPPTQRKRAA